MNTLLDVEFDKYKNAKNALEAQLTELKKKETALDDYVLKIDKEHNHKVESLNKQKRQIQQQHENVNDLLDCLNRDENAEECIFDTKKQQYLGHIDELKVQLADLKRKRNNNEEISEFSSYISSDLENTAGIYAQK